MMQHLKKIRLVFGLAIFIILFLSFIGIKSIMPSGHLSAMFAHIQLIPALLQTSLIIGVSIGIVIVFALLTFLFGRFYCSIICPLGIFQDIVSRIANVFKRCKIYRFSKASNILRYSLLAIVVLSLFTGSVLLLNFLDPYSNFGKIVSDLFRPIAIFMNDGLSRILESFDLYWIDPVGLRYISVVALIFPFIFLLVVSVLAALRGRLFCNTICPVGAGLSLISRFSFFKIKIEESNCTRCGKCSTVCKAECIDIKSKQIDYSRCISCYNCLTVCAEKGIDFKKAKFQPINKQLITKEPKSRGRRSFLTTSAVIVASTSALAWGKKSEKAENKGEHKNAITYKKKNAVCPPGAYSFANFNKHCTACHLCISACPTQVLQPSVSTYGMSGFMQPYLKFETSFCNYECTRCSEVCPTGALLPLTVEKKIHTQIGHVIFVKENCVVYTDETSCGACSEHCPTKAVAMVPYKGMLTIPHTTESICVGCGACEYACPVRPLRAIYVEGNLLHLAALKPENKKAEGGEMEEFPF